MDNISIALFGTPGLHNMYAWWDGNNYRIRCKAVHNPSGNYLFGLNRNDAKLTVQTPSGPHYQGIDAFGDFDAAPHYAPVRFYYNAIEVQAPSNYDCANITSTIGDQLSYPNYNTLLSNMNKIVFSSSTGLSDYPIEVTSGSSESCELVLLEADYTTTKPISSVSWEDPINVEISTTDSAIASGNGVYTFLLNLENGCTIEETISITSF